MQYIVFILFCFCFFSKASWGGWHWEAGGFTGRSKLWQEAPGILQDFLPWLCGIPLISKNGRTSSVQSLSCVWLFATPWMAACQASPSITNSWSLLKLTSTESVMPSNHLILCRPLLLPPSVIPSIGIFKWVSSLHQVTKVLEFQFQHQSFQWIFRTDFF